MGEFPGIGLGIWEIEIDELWFWFNGSLARRRGRVNGI